MGISSDRDTMGIWWDIQKTVARSHLKISGVASRINAPSRTWKDWNQCTAMETIDLAVWVHQLAKGLWLAANFHPELKYPLEV